MLYLAALTGSRCDPRLGAIRARFEAAGKPTKVALTATARRLLTIINAMLREGTDYIPQPV
jgi:transposase